VYSRFLNPYNVKYTGRDATDEQMWKGYRQLTDEEILELAQEIVIEVKQRGPFISLADFVNRRLVDQSDRASSMGVLDAAIAHVGLNDKFDSPPYLTSQVQSHDNNRPEWRLDPKKQSSSKAWGIPGFLTQGDLLESLAPAMTVRGDSFLIRAYGEARDEQGVIRAKAYLEAQVVRSVDYVDSSSNQANEPMLMLKRSSGELIEGDLTEVNRKFGRRFKVESFRWLSPNEV